MKYMAITFFLTLSFAAKASPELTNQNAFSALELPYQNRVVAIAKQGDEGRQQLIKIMFDQKASLEMRWRAVLTLGRVGGAEVDLQLERALKSKEWFMRNAALLALETFHPDKAREAARQLLTDPALVVRSAAVDSLVRLKDTSSVALLWSKLNAKENFRGTQSLWIRRQIVDALRALPQPGYEKADEKRFVELLEDRDEKLQAAAIQALESRTGQKLGKDEEPLKFRRAYWQKWAGEQALLENPTNGTTLNR
jgi:HEAT repeat protein